MSNTTLIVLIIQMVFIAGHGLMIFVHSQRIKQLVAMKPELQRSVSAVNAAILHASATLEDYRTQVGINVPVDLPPAPTPVAAGNRLSGLLDSLRKLQEKAA